MPFEPEDSIRRRVHIQGAVQGVGFRPFVYRLATELSLSGWVSNTSQGVRIEVEGGSANVAEFLSRIETDRPSLARVYAFETWQLDPLGYSEFEIVHSEDAGNTTVLVLPDIATCPDCLRELFDPGDRRYRYPFLNCTHCGPRYTIVRSLPYDRPNTSMSGFPLCRKCFAEYEDPADRRFHAQPIACPACGPVLMAHTPDGRLTDAEDGAILAACGALREGKIVAVKGIGGFHLMVDARDDAAVKRLRWRKQREHKPLAVMAPDLAYARRLADIGPSEERALSSPESPIVLARSHGHVLAPSIAPGNPNLGILLPSNPLHHLLVHELGFPVVATSGNLSDEPICTDNDEAFARLGGIADLFLVHDRPILRHVDDSIVRVMAGRESMVRRARGFAPLPVALARSGSECGIGFGAHLKSAVALSVDGQILLSQHVGDLETVEAAQAYDRVLGDLLGIYGVVPARAACDLHPDYLSTQRAIDSGIHLERVQHHLAHVAACMADNDLDPPVLGVSWDGTGLGTDRTIWGGEFILVEASGWTRAAHLRRFPLPGGDAAAREPLRSAAGLLFEISRDPPPSSSHTELIRRAQRRIAGLLEPREMALVDQALERVILTPMTSSAGRLFDAVSALLGLCAHSRYEGDAAMQVEFAADRSLETVALAPMTLHAETGGPSVLDWAPLVIGLLDAFEQGCDAASLARSFHRQLAKGIAETCGTLGCERVALTGGCFQNKTLLEDSIIELKHRGLLPYWHQRVPPNDGGIAVGQLAWIMDFSP